MSKPGFELQWKAKLDNQPRGVHGLAQGVTANGVTLFVPMSLVTGSSNNDLRRRQRHRLRRLAAAVRCAAPAADRGLSRRHHAGATRIVPLERHVDDPPAVRRRAADASGYRSLLGKPGEGVPVEGRAAGPGRSSEPAAAPDARRAALAAPHPAIEPRAASRRRRRRKQPAGRSAFQVHRAARCRKPSARPRRTGTVSCFGRPASSTSSRATACCTCSACRRARTCSGPHPSCPPTRDGHRRSRWTRRCMPRRSGNCGGAPNGDLGDRSRQRREAGRVVEHQRRAGRRRRGVHARTAR